MWIISEMLVALRKILAGLLMLFLAIFAVSKALPTSNAAQEPAAPSQPTFYDLLSKIDITKDEFRRSPGGLFLLSRFTVENKNDFPIKDVSVICKFAGNSGTIIDTRTTTIYEVVKANATNRLPEVQVGSIPAQSSTISCRISNFKRA